MGTQEHRRWTSGFLQEHFVGLKSLSTKDGLE